MIPVALTIAGSDPSGGAGLQADLKTFHARGVYGEAVVSLLTVQNTRGVKSVSVLSPALVKAQLETVLEDIAPKAAKTGALGNERVISAVARAACAFRFPLVVDPVMISKNGSPLLSRRASETLKEKLFPLAVLVTPNLHEASVLTGLKVNDEESMTKAAEQIAGFGARAVLIKGGHLRSSKEAVDLLYERGKITAFRSSRVHTRHTHGTGCTFSAAITAELAKGNDLVSAVRTAKHFISRAIETAPGLGKGSGPVNHFAVIE